MLSFERLGLIFLFYFLFCLIFDFCLLVIFFVLLVLLNFDFHWIELVCFNRLFLVFLNLT
ncbi:hypothetical protein HPPC_05565 [Helicobacter pylori PeCan4]|nr:hypothetical protein HPPC_05565 [Helicobacter pylori PeCan4]